MSTPQGASRFGGNSNPQSSPSPGAGGSNVFTRKIGPLPLWGWMGIGLAVALVFYFWKQNKAKQQNSTGQSITPPGTGADQTRSASQIPQFVNLTNVQNAQSQKQDTTKNITQTTPPVTQPPPPAPSNVPAWVGSLTGMSLAQAVQTIQQNGWVVNSTDLLGKAGVRFNQGVAFDNPAYQNFKVSAASGMVQGHAGSNFANSVDLVINET